MRADQRVTTGAEIARDVAPRHPCTTTPRHGPMPARRRQRQLHTGFWPFTEALERAVMRAESRCVRGDQRVVVSDRAARTSLLASFPNPAALASSKGTTEGARVAILFDRVLSGSNSSSAADRGAAAGAGGGAHDGGATTGTADATGGDHDGGTASAGTGDGAGTTGGSCGISRAGSQVPACASVRVVPRADLLRRSLESAEAITGHFYLRMRCIISRHFPTLLPRGRTSSGSARAAPRARAAECR